MKQKRPPPPPEPRSSNASAPTVGLRSLAVAASQPSDPLRVENLAGQQRNAVGERHGGGRGPVALSIRTDIVLQVGIDHATTVAGFGSSSLLLYLAVTLGTQRGRDLPQSD